MHALLSCLFAGAIAISSALPQTTGVAGINDYTINSMGAGSTSCTTLCFPAPVVLNLDVSTANGNLVLFLFSWCPCMACSTPWLTNTCFPAIPATACGSITNQSVDVLFSVCPLFVLGFGVAAGGVASMTLNVPPLGPGLPCTNGRGSTQAVVFDACGLGGGSLTGPFVVTQGYFLNF